MPQPTQDQLAAWRVFLEAHARITGLLARELQERAGLPLAWYDVLVQLSEAPGGHLRMTELANRVLLSKAGLSRLVDRMAAAGLVDRQACPSDRRGTDLLLTQRGTSALDLAAPIHLAGVWEHFSRHLSPEETAAIAGGLARVGRG